MRAGWSLVSLYFGPVYLGTLPLMHFSLQFP
jgi:hypothetical protein